MKVGVVKSIVCAVIRAIAYIVFGVNIGHSSADNCAICVDDADSVEEVSEHEAS